MNKELLDISRIRDPDQLHTSIIEFCKNYNIEIKLTSEYEVNYLDGNMRNYRRVIDINDIIYYDRIMGNQGFLYDTNIKRIILNCKINNTNREYSIFLK